MHKLTQGALWLVQRAEGATKTDLRYFFSGGRWLLIGYALQVATGLILSVAFANLLPKESFGTYQFILSMAAIASVFTLTGMGSAIIQASAGGSQSALRYGFRVQLLWSSGIALVCAVLTLYYFTQQNTVLGWSFLVVGLLQPFIIGLNLYKWYLQARELFRESAVIETLQRLVPFVAVLGTLLVTTEPFLLIVAYFTSSAISLLCAYVYVVRTHKLTKVADPKLVNYSKHLSVMESFAEAANAADKALIWFFLGGAPLAAYALAQLPVIHLQTIFGFARPLAFPKLARKSMPEIRAILPQKVRLYFFVAVVAVGFYILIAPTLFALLFPLYPEAVLYSQLLALSVLAVPRSLVTQAFIAHQRKRELYIINVSVPVIRIGLLAILLWQFGIWGAIAAILITELFAALVQWYLLARIK